MWFFGNHDSTAYRGCTRPFAFPHSGHIITKVDGLRLCRFADCKTCSLSPEYVPIHYECYEIFRASCSVKGTDALHRLWVVAAWKRPWRKAQPIRLRGAVDVGVLRMVAHRARLPLLAKLPAEVIDMIYGHSPHALLWRCVSATSLAMQVSATEPQPLSMIPLGDVLSWERHGQLKYAGHTWTTMHASLLLRLPIRSDGISKVERLSSLPQPEARNSTTSAFVIVRVKFIDGVVLQLQDGLVRLHFPLGQRTFPVWNTPSPPDLSSCCIHSIKLSNSWQRFYAVDMDRVQGVTFFFSGARLFGIHSHVSEGASALSTYEGIPTGCRRGMVWIYLPMPRSDQLLVLGVRAKSSSSPCVNILIRTRLAGDVVIGQHSPGGVKDRCLGRSAPITLIYGESKVGFPVPHFGAYCQFSADARLPEPFPLATSYHSLIGSDAYFSWASLSGITSALTYYDSKTGFCRGILLQYDNGGARTLGQCRRQVDPAEEVYKTRMLCWRTEMYRSQRQRMVHRTQVRFQHDPQHEHDNKWKCHALEGVLHFWFTDEATFLVVIN